jgi:hypothetical protein
MESSGIRDFITPISRIYLHFIQMPCQGEELGIKTKGEITFEKFCTDNGLSFEKIEEGNTSTPDYLITLEYLKIYVEIKQIDEDKKFAPEGMFRTPGSHIRKKIEDSRTRKQMRVACNKGFPAILLVYNNLDPCQAFGTEQHDFLSGMYGDLTNDILKTNNSISEIYHGKNQSLRVNKNESFSAVGWLYTNQNGVGVHIYENMFAKIPINYETLPSCIQFNRVSE